MSDLRFSAEGVMHMPDDDHLTRSVTELGEPDSLYHIGRSQWLTKLSIGVALVLFGLIANYFWWFHGPATFGHFELLILLMMPGAGAAMLYHMYRERGLFVLIYPVGLLRLRRGEVDSIPWSDVDHIQLKVDTSGEPDIARDDDGTLLSCSLPANVPTFQLWNASLSITRDDGITISFSPALSHYDQLADEVQLRTFPHLWPLVWRRFLDGATLPFGPLDVKRTGLEFGGKEVPWSEVSDVSITQGKLTVKKGRKWLPWAMADLSTIPNPHILYALIHEARRLVATAPPVEQPETDGVA